MNGSSQEEAVHALLLSNSPVQRNTWTSQIAPSQAQLASAGQHPLNPGSWLFLILLLRITLTLFASWLPTCSPSCGILY